MNSEQKEWRSPLVKIVVSLIAALIGYIMALESTELKVRLIAAYAGWSWFWGLVILYPNYIKQVKSVKVTAMRGYSYIHYGAFYICQALLFGFIGGGVYRFIKECYELYKTR